MARIRTIKPELPQSESIGRLSRDARLLFIQLFTVADDEGRARASSRLLASLLYPYDDDAAELIDGWLTELEDANCVRRYVVESTTYLEIVKWLEHQKIDRPSPSRLPAFDTALAKPREPSRALDADLGPSILDQDQDSRAVAGAPRPPVRSKEIGQKAAKLFAEFWLEYPRREGANPKEPAAKKFLTLVAGGAELREDVAAEIIAGAKRYAAACVAQVTAPRFVAQAVTWLNQKRWTDYSEAALAPPTPNLGGKYYAAAGSDQLDAWDAYRDRTEGKTYPRDKAGGWIVPSEWPPDHGQAVAA